MSQDRLSSLALIYIEKELAIKIDLQALVEQFGSINGRQMKFK